MSQVQLQFDVKERIWHQKKSRHKQTQTNRNNWLTCGRPCCIPANPEQKQVELHNCFSLAPSISLSFSHDTYGDEGLVLDAVVPLCVSQSLQNVKALLYGLQGALQVTQLLLQATYYLGLLFGQTLNSRLLLLFQSLLDG